jgi:hypothetical protein
MAAQLPDFIIINKEKTGLYSNPLELFWTARKKRRPSFVTTEDCKRGYVATWEIHNKQLYLKDIEGTVERHFLFFKLKPKAYTMKNIFSKYRGRAIKAKWFSGKLRVPRGNMTAYDHNDYNSRFEMEVIITVDRGEVIKMVTLDYKQQALIVN